MLARRVREATAKGGQRPAGEGGPKPGAPPAHEAARAGREGTAGAARRARLLRGRLCCGSGRSRRPGRVSCRAPNMFRRAGTISKRRDDRSKHTWQGMQQGPHRRHCRVSFQTRRKGKQSRRGQTEWRGMWPDCRPRRALGPIFRCTKPGGDSWASGCGRARNRRARRGRAAQKCGAGGHALAASRGARVRWCVAVCNESANKGRECFKCPGGAKGLGGGEAQVGERPGDAGARDLRKAASQLGRSGWARAAGSNLVRPFKGRSKAGVGALGTEAEASGRPRVGSNVRR